MQTSRRVSWVDCDPSGRIRYQAAFDWFVDAEVAFLRERGVAWAFERMPRVSASAGYRAPLGFDDLVEIDVAVAEIGRSSVTWSFAARKDGVDAVTGEVTCVYVLEGRSASLPDELRSALGAA
jgi:acyl-CoA thioester hydrolase